MLSAILVILAMPFTDLSRSRGIQFRPLSKIAFYIFVANFLILMVLGAKHVESPFIEFGQISTVIYFSHFLIIVPVVSLIENSLIDLNTTKNYSSNNQSGIVILKSSVNSTVIFAGILGATTVPIATTTCADIMSNILGPKAENILLGCSNVGLAMGLGLYHLIIHLYP
jgi:ubiquinol-cytochrome c reductase cytochrome b subunit